MQGAPEPLRDRRREQWAQSGADDGAPPGNGFIPEASEDACGVSPSLVCGGGARLKAQAAPASKATLRIPQRAILQRSEQAPCVAGRYHRLRRAPSAHSARCRDRRVPRGFPQTQRLGRGQEPHPAASPPEPALPSVLSTRVPNAWWRVWTEGGEGCMRARTQTRGGGAEARGSRRMDGVWNEGAGAGRRSGRTLLTGLRAAAGVGAARAADVAAAAVRAALAPADPDQHKEQHDSQGHQADEHPLWKGAQRGRARGGRRRTRALAGAALRGGVSGRDLGVPCHRAQSPQTGEERRGECQARPSQGWGVEKGGRGPPGRLGHALSSTRRWRGVQAPSWKGVYLIHSSVRTGLGQEQAAWWLGAPTAELQSCRFRDCIFLVVRLILLLKAQVSRKSSGSPYFRTH